MQAQNATQQEFTNTITHGDCIRVMRAMPANSVDFILTDPLLVRPSSVSAAHETMLRGVANDPPAKFSRHSKSVT